MCIVVIKSVLCVDVLVSVDLCNVIVRVVVVCIDFVYGVIVFCGVVVVGDDAIITYSSISCVLVV